MEVKEELVNLARRENDEFRRLENEHRHLDEEIDEKFGGRRFLTPEEEMEKKILQKQKLAKKDRMYQLLREHMAAAS